VSTPCGVREISYAPAFETGSDKFGAIRVLSTRFKMPVVPKQDGTQRAQKGPARSTKKNVELRVTSYRSAVAGTFMLGNTWISRIEIQRA
jgi:hypothetical protein